MTRRLGSSPGISGQGPLGARGHLLRDHFFLGDHPRRRREGLPRQDPYGRQPIRWAFQGDVVGGGAVRVGHRHSEDPREPQHCDTRSEVDHMGLIYPLVVGNLRSCGLGDYQGRTVEGIAPWQLDRQTKRKHHKKKPSGQPHLNTVLRG